MPATTLPRGEVREVDGMLKRVISHLDETTGEPYEEFRPVALTLKEAQAEGADFYDPAKGWIRGGIKTERENPMVRS